MKPLSLVLQVALAVGAAEVEEVLETATMAALALKVQTERYRL